MGQIAYIFPAEGFFTRNGFKSFMDERREATMTQASNIPPLRGGVDVYTWGDDLEVSYSINQLLRCSRTIDSDELFPAAQITVACPRKNSGDDISGIGNIISEAYKVFNAERGEE